MSQGCAHALVCWSDSFCSRTGVGGRTSVLLMLPSSDSQLVLTSNLLSFQIKVAP